MQNSQCAGLHTILLRTFWLAFWLRNGLALHRVFKFIISYKNMEIQRIAPPHPAFSEVGPRLLIKEFAPEKAVDLELFIADGKNLSGLELQCVSRKCGELHSLKEFSCPRCSGPVEFKHDLVIEDDNSQHIKPNTLRISCEPCQESYSSAIDNLPWLCGANGCKSMLAYGLVGNETTELVFALCLEIASRVNATTNLYRAVLSADSTTKALELLVDARLLESQKNNFHIGRIINEPKHYQITRKGDKKLAEYRTNFSRAGLLDILYGFITWRINTLRKAESTRSYDLLKDAVGRMQARNLPEDVRASLLKDKLSDVRIRRELAAYAAEFMREGKTNEMPAWLRDFYGMNTIEYFTTHKKARSRLYEYNKNTELTEEIVDALLNVRGR